MEGSLDSGLPTIQREFPQMYEEERTTTILFPCQVFHLDKAHFLRGSTRFFENFKGTLVEKTAFREKQN